jgi:hypothetical protein
MKWDSSHKEQNLRTGRTYTVRECFFQDDVSAQTLRDIDGKRLTLREFGSERLLAIAKRNKSEWICTRFGAPGERPAYAFLPTKDQAIDFLCGVESPEPLPGL